MSYVKCRYSILNGLIDSREVRRVKAAGMTRSSGATWHLGPWKHASYIGLSQWLHGALPCLPTPRYENLLYFISYIQSILSKTVSYTLVNKIMCSITLHRPLWEHLENRRAGQGTHLSKGSSTTIRTVVDITPTISHLREMHKSCSLYVYVWMCVLCHMVYVCETM
jgi:hypothetical protein